MKRTFYAKYIKRLLDIVCSFLALTVFSPLYLTLMVIGAIEMKGNPFFTQERPGYKERFFKLIKFRSMTNEKDENGNLLPDELRINSYGRFLRLTSLDELPEAINIFVGDMSVVGPRPLLVRYLPYYNEDEKHRHDVRPGLTGLAQISGRNYLSWDDRFKKDVEYVNNITFIGDVIIIIKTMINVLHVGKSINISNETVFGDFDEWRKAQQDLSSK